MSGRPNSITIFNTREGQTIECMCCYVESSFDDMVQCPEGHLFCTTCLQRLCNEAVSGTGKSRLSCMAPNCEAVFLNSQLQKALDEQTLERLNKQKQFLKLANENLFKCPHCGFTADIGEYSQKVFHCQNKNCRMDGFTIKCMCCYEKISSDDMVQCSEGHLFCTTCLRGLCNEAMNGGGKSRLSCMVLNCEAVFLNSQLGRALDENTLKRLSEREQHEALKLANIKDLFNCPHCDFAADIGEYSQKVFFCQNQRCQKQTCIKCQEPWDEGHIGIPCEQVVNINDTNMRTAQEEKMTEAIVRKCWQCQTILLKSGGCNMVTCRCGLKMCYICRKPNIDMSHFCNHPRDLEYPCSTCKKCSLWAEEDNDHVVTEVQKKEQQIPIASGSSTSSTEQLQVHVGPRLIYVTETNLREMEFGLDDLIRRINRTHDENLARIHSSSRSS